MGHSNKEIKVVSKGYAVEVRSWEYACENSVGLLIVPTQVLADELSDLVRLFKRGGLLGNKNSYDYKTTGIKDTFVELLNTKHKAIIDYAKVIHHSRNELYDIVRFKKLSSADLCLALFDNYIAFPLNLLGEEYAVYRECYEYTVTYSDKDVYVSTYKKEEWGKEV